MIRASGISVGNRSISQLTGVKSSVLFCFPAPSPVPPVSFGTFATHAYCGLAPKPWTATMLHPISEYKDIRHDIPKILLNRRFPMGRGVKNVKPQRSLDLKIHRGDTTRPLICLFPFRTLHGCSSTMNICFVRRWKAILL